jgi:hypothetical protein
MTRFSTVMGLFNGSVEHFGDRAKYVVLDDIVASHGPRPCGGTNLYIDKWKYLVNHIRSKASIPQDVSDAYIAANTFVTGNVPKVFRRTALRKGGITSCGRCTGRIYVRHWRGYNKVCCGSCGRYLMHNNNSGDGREAWSPDWNAASLETLLDTIDDGVAPNTCLVELTESGQKKATACVSNSIVFYEHIDRDETKPLDMDTVATSTAILAPCLAEKANGVPFLRNHPVIGHFVVTAKETVKC